MLAVTVSKPGTVELAEVPKPAPGPYQALVRTELASLCNATDRKLVEGHFPGVESYPLLLGHESAGIVEAVGEKVRTFKAGDRVIGGLLLDPPGRYASGWGGFSEYTLAGDHLAMVEDGVATSEHGWYEVYEIMRAVPQWLPVEAAVLLCTWREVYAGFGDFDLRAGNDILIFGAGPVGLSFVKFARLLGLGYIGLVDTVPEKRQKALEMGADAVFAPDAPELLRLTSERGKPLDAVVDAVGKESIINAALPLIRMAGSVCVYGVIDTPTITLEKARGPYNFNLLVHQWPTRAREAAAQEPLCEWVKAGKLSHTEFVSAEYPISRINEALDIAKSGRPLKTLLRF
jgi:threonine dehydrogenase-like Zn-dependent dehydrogenase